MYDNATSMHGGVHAPQTRQIVKFQIIDTYLEKLISANTSQVAK